MLRVEMSDHPGTHDVGKNAVFEYDRKTMVIS